MNELWRLFRFGAEWLCGAQEDQVDEEKQASMWFFCCETPVPRVVRCYDSKGDTDADSISLLEVPAELNSLTENKIEYFIPEKKTEVEEELSRCAEWETLRDLHFSPVIQSDADHMSRRFGPRGASSMVESDCSFNQCAYENDGSSYSSVFLSRPSLLEPRRTLNSRKGLRALVQDPTSHRRVSKDTIPRTGSTRILLPSN